MNRDMYNMKLNEAITIPSFLGEITRVPGGWIYREDCESGQGGYNMTSCFVPWSSEFQPTNNDGE